MVKNKAYILLLLSILPVLMINGMEHASQLHTEEQEFSSLFDNEPEPESIPLSEQSTDIKSSALQRYFKETINREKLLNNSDNYILLTYPEQNQAMAIFSDPEKSEIPVLTEMEIAYLKQLFPIHSVETRGNYKAIIFSYEESDLLPLNREQALYLLYASYTQDRKKNPQDLYNEKEILFEKEKIKHIRKSLAEKHNYQHMKAKVKTTRPYAREGLAGSTRVKTINGHSQLQDLKVGDKVMCYDIEKSKETFSTITDAQTVRLPQHVQIVINNQELKVSPYHKFYIPELKEWVTAQELAHDANLCSYLDPNIQDVVEVNKELDVIVITVDSTHNFFITDNNILVHNYIPIVIEVFIAFEIGKGAVITWGILAPTAIAVATGLLYYFVDSLTSETPKDILFTPGPMQDYAHSFGKDKLDVQFYPHGSIDNARQTHTTAASSHKSHGQKNNSVQSGSAHNGKDAGKPYKTEAGKVKESPFLHNLSRVSSHLAAGEFEKAQTVIQESKQRLYNTRITHPDYQAIEDEYNRLCAQYRAHIDPMFEKYKDDPQYEYREHPYRTVMPLSDALKVMEARHQAINSLAYRMGYDPKNLSAHDKALLYKAIDHKTKNKDGLWTMIAHKDLLNEQELASLKGKLECFKAQLLTTDNKSTAVAPHATVEATEIPAEDAQHESSITASPPPLKPEEPEEKEKAKQNPQNKKSTNEYEDKLKNNNEYKECLQKLNEIKKELSDKKVEDYFNVNCDWEKVDIEANKLYEQIRNNPNDIQKVANNLKILEKYAQQVKDHIFYKKHQLDHGIDNFYPDKNIGEAWQRLVSNKYVKSDLEWFLHELAESSLTNEFPNCNQRDIHSYVMGIHNWEAMLIRK